MHSICDGSQHILPLFSFYWMFRWMSFAIIINLCFFYILVIEQNERFTHQITPNVINHNIHTFFLSLFLYIYSLWSTFPRDFSFDLILFDVWKCIEFWDMRGEISLFMHYLENYGDKKHACQILQNIMCRNFQRLKIYLELETCN